MSDAVIIGGGPGGISAALTLRQRGKSVTIVSAGTADSLLYQAERVDNYPGMPGVSGGEMLEQMTRQAADLGADFIKSEFVGGREFRQVVEHCYVPILVLGGGKAKTQGEIFAHIRAAMDCGAKGVIMGRNILRHENAPRVCSAIAAIIHNDASVEDALKILEG